MKSKPLLLSSSLSLCLFFLFFFLDLLGAKNFQEESPSDEEGGGDGDGSKQKFQLKKIISCCYDLQAQVQKFLLPLKGFAVVPPSYPPTTIIIHNNLVLWDSRQGYLLCSAFHGCPKRALRRQV